MAAEFLTYLKRIWGNSSVFFFALFWTFSVAAGILLGAKSQLFFSPMMLKSCNGSMSIVSMCLLFVLSLFVSLILIRFKASFLIIPIALFRGFVFGFIATLIYYSFGFAGWLVYLLFLLPDSILNLTLLYFWINHLQTPYSNLLKNFAGCLVIGFAVCVFNLVIIQPLFFTII